MSHHIK